MTTQSNLDYLFSLKGDTITKDQIFTLFNKTSRTKTDGTIEVLEPMFYPWEEITVKKGQLSSIKEDTKTRVGLYVFNLTVMDFAFSDSMPYINYTIKQKEMSRLSQDICDKLLLGKVTGQQFAHFQERIIWWNNFTEILMAGLTTSLLVLPKEIKDELQRLIDENKDCIINNDTIEYLRKVEKPILAFAKNYYKTHNDPGWSIYALGGKPKFDNVFKNMFLAVGPIYDIATGKYRISTRCFSDGIDPKEQELYANSAIMGAYNRACATAYYGAKVKNFAAAFQSMVVTEDDCGSTDTIDILVTKDNMYDVEWRWIKSNEEGNDKGFILVTPENIAKYIGKVVQARSPLFCKSDNFCWKCVGDVYKRTGIKNVGLTLMKLTSCFLNKALKSMHDSSLSFISFDPTDCFYSA